MDTKSFPNILQMMMNTGNKMSILSVNILKEDNMYSKQKSNLKKNRNSQPGIQLHAMENLA